MPTIRIHSDGSLRTVTEEEAGAFINAGFATLEDPDYAVQPQVATASVSIQPGAHQTTTEFLSSAYSQGGYYGFLEAAQRAPQRELEIAYEQGGYYGFLEAAQRQPKPKSKVSLQPEPETGITGHVDIADAGDLNPMDPEFGTGPGTKADPPPISGTERQSELLDSGGAGVVPSGDSGLGDPRALGSTPGAGGIDFNIGSPGNGNIDPGAPESRDIDALSLTAGFATPASGSLPDASRRLSGAIGLDPERTISAQAGAGELGLLGDILCAGLDLVDADHCQKALEREMMNCYCPC